MKSSLLERRHIGADEAVGWPAMHDVLGGRTAFLASVALDADEVFVEIVDHFGAVEHILLEQFAGETVVPIKMDHYGNLVLHRCLASRGDIGRPVDFLPPGSLAGECH